MEVLVSIEAHAVQLPWDELTRAWPSSLWPHLRSRLLEPVLASGTGVSKQFITKGLSGPIIIVQTTKKAQEAIS